MPKLEVSTDHINYIALNGHELSKDGVSASDLGGVNGNTTTFFLLLTLNGLLNKVSSTGQREHPGITALYFDWEYICLGVTIRLT